MEPGCTIFRCRQVSDAFPDKVFYRSTGGPGVFPGIVQNRVFVPSPAPPALPGTCIRGKWRTVQVSPNGGAPAPPAEGAEGLCPFEHGVSAPPAEDAGGRKCVTRAYLRAGERSQSIRGGLTAFGDRLADDSF